MHAFWTTSRYRFAVRLSLAIAAAVLGVTAASSCGPKSKSEKTTASDAEIPAPRPPTCEVAVAEFTFRVKIHNERDVRDSLVGECVDLGWNGTERQCVANAGDTVSLADCVVTSTRIVAINLDSARSVGIGDCDRAIASYRSCISNNPPGDMPLSNISDTQEALEITLAAWRDRVDEGDEEGWREVQRECSTLVRSLERTLARYGCSD